jgi:protoporphyrinogen oxidase/glycosyltransferase involved in cell wall biosynthesis
MRNSAAIIVFSHLRWNFVYQRPQHLLSRLAKDRRVYFIEEPTLDESGPSHWEINHPEPNVTVLRPHTPYKSFGYSEEQLPEYRTLLKQFFSKEKVGEHALWFYTPMALPLADLFTPQAVIYDCMDELSKFLNAPPEMLEREARLMQFADVVFTGGPSLYRAKKDRHPNVHCFASSVETEHFAKGVVEQPEAKEQESLPRPRLGYYGVIDERINLELIDHMAATHPEWQVVMVGPVVKIDPARLPRRENIHYSGQKNYAELPSYLKGWDVCLQPFAKNDSTEFISPTKTLEYMAARKVIVSTSIRDVVEPYGHIVFIGDTPAEFTAGCERALALEKAEYDRRMEEGQRVLARTSWDRTVNAMSKEIADVIEKKKAGVTPQKQAEREMEPVVVIGAGPTGLSAAYHLGDEAVLIEQNDRVGGWCRSIEDKGFTFDFAGHIMFSADPYVHQLYQMLLGDNVHWQDREAWIYSKNVYTRYPFQGSLYGLPADVIKECIIGAVESRYGSLKPAKAAGSNGAANGHTNGHANGGYANGSHANGGANGHANGSNGVHAANGSSTNGSSTNGSSANGASLTNGSATNGSSLPKMACSKDASITDCCADGVLESSAPLGKNVKASAENKEPQNFEEFIYKVWGAGIAKHFAIPYNRKLWAVPLTEMETSWLGGRVPMPDLEEMIEGALKPSPKPMGPNARFGYPLRGGFQALMDGFLPHLKGDLLLNTGVTAVSPSKKTVRLSNGREIKYSNLVSTMPLPALIKAMGNEVPAEIRAAVDRLEHVSVRCVNIGVGRENLTEKHWIYYPEDTVFHRIFVQGNASPNCNPPGGFGLTCEITYSPHKPLPCDGNELIQLCIDDCRRVGIFGDKDPVWAANQVDMPYAYVVYNHARKQAVETIREWLSKNGILLAGRYSEWEYYNSDHAFIAGKKVADKIRRLREPAQVEATLLTGSGVSAGVFRRE